MKARANQYGEEFTQMKIEANKEKMAIIDKHKADGSVLYNQISELKGKLEDQKKMAAKSQMVVEDVKRRMQ